MHTAPDDRSSRSTESLEEPDTMDSTLSNPDKLKVVPKNRVGIQENILADRVFKGLVIFCALAIIVIVALIVFELVSQSRLSMTKFGFKFLIAQIWDPVAENF